MYYGLNRASDRRFHCRRSIATVAIFIILLSVVILTGCTDADEEKDMNTNPVATMVITSQTGEQLKIKINLYPDKAPVTVDNFIQLANSGFYDGLHFHRIVPGGCLQGGAYEFIQTDNGLTLTEPSREIKAIEGEFASNGHPENDIRHTKGTISMARTSDPNSATSQFFLCVGDYPSWDGEYAAFGMATDPDSLAALDKLSDSAYVYAGGAFQTLPYPLIRIVSVRVE